MRRIFYEFKCLEVLGLSWRTNCFPDSCAMTPVDLTARTDQLELAEL